MTPHVSVAQPLRYSNIDNVLDLGELARETDGVRREAVEAGTCLEVPLDQVHGPPVQSCGSGLLLFFRLYLREPSDINIYLILLTKQIICWRHVF